MNPFALDADGEVAYRRWRQWKLDLAPRHADDLVVGVGDPLNLQAHEVDALALRCRVANMAFYAGPGALGENKDVVTRVGACFGLERLDVNWLADEDGVSSITPRSGLPRQDFIPYTERAIRWHTDGYYNPPERPIRSMLLHCVRPARAGGENALLDPDIAYILLRDENPGFVRALSAPQAMTIPARADDTGEGRAEVSGPVFRVDPDSGDLNMRYTARSRSILWADDAVLREAAGFLLAQLDGPPGFCPWVHRLRMSAGMGLLCNNVLHDRAGFSDGPDALPGEKRLLFRARFHDRIAQTLGACKAAFA